MDAPSSDSERDLFTDRPSKRARRSSPKRPSTAGSLDSTHDDARPQRSHMHNGNGTALQGADVPPKPALQPSIIGVEPLDEFIREIADFVHHMITTRPEGPGLVEVEAKVGVLRDKMSGQRLQLPVLVETSAFAIHSFILPARS